MALQKQVSTAFQNKFGTSPTVIRAPGRVNLIGEHTDYNDGFVLPMTINRAVWIALRPRKDVKVIVHSLDENDTLNFSLDNFSHTDSGWGEYIKGVAHALQMAGHLLGGWEGVMAGDVPIGAGLSSSAALELATARAFFEAGHFEWNPVEMAKAGQAAENDWVGVNCGIMDQLISAAGEAEHALFIDCRTLKSESVPLASDAVTVILDTGVRRGLVDSAYNERRIQCENAARFFGVSALRDVDLATFEARKSELDPLTRKRARHVITENARVLDAAKALKANDFRAFGQLMNESHLSLRDDFEVSCAELNRFVEAAQSEAGCFGARMTGGGFGGCAVAWVEANAVDNFTRNVREKYENATKHRPNIYVTHATAGATTL